MKEDRFYKIIIFVCIVKSWIIFIKIINFYIVKFYGLSNIKITNKKLIVTAIIH
jgi:hypothetical protein